MRSMWPASSIAIDGELDIHVAFDLAAASLVDELFGRLSQDRITVVVEPVDHWPN